MEFSVSSVINNKHISIESGRLAKQANGSVLVKSGGTVVLVTACMSQEVREGVDFFPLIVDYQEKTYAAGRIPGGFFKREGRPKDLEILSARLVDRSIRPLFPEGMRNEVQIVCIVVSSDAENDPDILAVNGASSALTISDIPFEGPLGAARVIKKGEEFIINPTYKEREEASLDLIVSATQEKILMIEAKANRVSEEVILKGISLAHNYIRELITKQEELRKKVGGPKKKIEFFKEDEGLLEEIKTNYNFLFSNIYVHKDKEKREEARREAISFLKEKLQREDLDEGMIKSCFYKLEKKFVRKKIREEKIRPDGRRPSELRPIWCQVRVLPRTHGSAVFSRGQTQSLAVTTLGTSSDQQMIEALEGQSFKHFILHYSFPPFSVGEVSPLRGPSRREIGHGALAEKSLEFLIPSREVFPYTIRVVSEILESNGSSSMASVCAASLSLMDAGVPIEEPVAGVALGLISEPDSYLLLVDISGIEDHCGDMDFKVAGTERGITAIQLDLKIQGIDYPVLKEALNKAREARMEILEKMRAVISQPRSRISEFAPKIKQVKINPDKIGELIGPGGRTIRKITSQTQVTIDIDDEEGVVTISADNERSLEEGVRLVEEICQDLEVGKIYKAKIVKITNFGAFCEIFPGGKSGLLHISEISSDFVKNINDYLKEGQIIKVKVIGIDESGRVTLSKKQVDKEGDRG